MKKGLVRLGQALIGGAFGMAFGLPMLLILLVIVPWLELVERGSRNMMWVAMYAGAVGGYLFASVRFRDERKATEKTGR
jgi:hypothetical protein